MHRNTKLAFLLILSFMGIADAAYLAESAYTGSALSCGIGALDGCNIVAQSPYAHLFGIPLGTYGVFFYGFVFALSAATLAFPGLKARRALFALGIVGAAASVVFLGIQFFLIKALCIYCLGSAVIAFLVAWITHALRDRHAVPAVVEPWSA
jgi:uncharacterized membrane protein